jgi:hypothetical protein
MKFVCLSGRIGWEADSVTTFATELEALVYRATTFPYAEWCGGNVWADGSDRWVAVGPEGMETA